MCGGRANHVELARVVRCWSLLEQPARARRVPSRIGLGHPVGRVAGLASLDRGVACGTLPATVRRSDDRRARSTLAVERGWARRAAVVGFGLPVGPPYGREIVLQRRWPRAVASRSEPPSEVHRSSVPPAQSLAARVSARVVEGSASTLAGSVLRYGPGSRRPRAVCDVRARPTGKRSQVCQLAATCVSTMTEPAGQTWSWRPVRERRGLTAVVYSAAALKDMEGCTCPRACAAARCEHHRVDL